MGGGAIFVLFVRACLCPSVRWNGTWGISPNLQLRNVGDKYEL